MTSEVALEAFKPQKLLAFLGKDRHGNQMWQLQCGTCEQVRDVKCNSAKRAAKLCTRCNGRQLRKQSAKLWKAGNHSPKGQVGLNLLWGNYKAGAKARGHTWSLTKEQFAQITSRNCEYCGCPPKMAVYCRSKDISEERREKSKYVYSGVDRQDSSVGYTPDNCVAACKNCNLGKQGLSVEEFLTWVRDVAEFNK